MANSKIEYVKPTPAVRRNPAPQDFSFDHFTKEQIIQMLKEYKVANIELLEDKRLSIMKTQDQQKFETNSNTSELYSTTNTESSTSNAINTSTEQKSTMDVNMNLTCTCNLQTKLNEVIRFNHIWQKDYTTLLDENNNTKVRLRALEKQLDVAHNLNAVLQTETLEMREYIERKEGQLFSLSNEVHQNIYKDEVEALKQQLSIYKEDFDREQKEKKELQVKLKAIKRDLGTSLKTIDKIKSEKNDLRQNYRRASFQKEHILSELRRLSTTSLPLSPVMPPSYHIRDEDLNQQFQMQHTLVERDTKIQDPPIVFEENVKDDSDSKKCQHVKQFEIKRSSSR